MPEQGHPTAPRIVVGIDGSQSSTGALRWAIRQAALTGATVDAVIAWQYPAAAGGYGWAPTGLEGSVDFKENAGRVMAEAIGSVTPGNGAAVRTRVVEGIPAQVLLDASDGADLLVVGSRGHAGFTEALLGSVSQHCVHHAHCPVVIIRGKEHD
jgi:nucleotide-binding universal stress UspA family protein